jgi:glycosyltransferase involved in cell wall biosynthesis
MIGVPEAAGQGGRRRVLFVMIQMQMGGAERLVLNLIESLDRDAFEPSVAWFVGDTPLPEFVRLGIPLHFVPKRRRFGWSTMSGLSRIIREERIDVVNAHHFMPAFYAYYGARLANRAHLIYTEHSENDVLNASGAWRTIGTHVLNRCDGAIGVSEPVSRLLTQHFRLPRERVRTIENGVDYDRFAGGGGDRVRARSAAGFADDQTVIGIVANFRRNKNHQFLIAAFNEVRRARPRAHLVIVGQGFPGDPESSEQEIHEAIRTAGLGSSVSVLGYRSDVREVLWSLDVFCLVSRREGLPLSLIEAMAAGVPVVGTDVAGIRDVVAHDRNGLLVAPDDVPALAATLIRLADCAKLRGRLAGEARRVVRDRYSFQRCVDQTQQFFSAVCDDRSAAAR